MSDDPSSIGLQHPAFAVSKLKLLEWLNEFFELSYVKVEECATGAIYCQILDCIYPGSIPMSKVDWKARNEYQFVNNFKLVQNCLTKKHISKPVHIDKLVKAKYQDNLEFLQWFKHFFECKYSGNPYNAKERRGQKGGTAKKAVVNPVTNTRGKVSTRPASAKATATKSSASKVSSKDSAANDEQIAALTSTVEGLEKERDFYFGKLREVEVLCQGEDLEGLKKEFADEVLKILYKTDDDAEAPAAEAAAPAEDDETF